MPIRDEDVDWTAVRSQGAGGQNVNKVASAVHLRFDVLGWVTLIFATIAAVVTISFGYAGRVGSQARDREYREETR